MPISFFLFLAIACSSQIAMAAGSWGEQFVPKQEVSFRIVERDLKRIPEKLPVYAKGASVFKSQGIEWIIDNAVDDAGTRKALKGRLSTNAWMVEAGRTVLHEDERFRLVLNPAEGRILFALQPAPAAHFERTSKAPTGTNFLAKEVFDEAMQTLTGKLGIPASEIERKRDGSFNITGSDGNRFPNHQKDPELCLRMVSYNRASLVGYPMTSSRTPFTISLERFVDGSWKQIFINWPSLSTNGFVRSPRTIAELKATLKSGKALWDYNNEFGAGDVKSISVTGIRVVYSTAISGDSFPVVCLDSKVTVGRKEEYAVIFIPLHPEQNAEPK